MFEAQVVRLEFTQKVKVWVPPRHRFIQYGPEDEWWMRKYGVGEEKELTQTVVIPRAIITGMDGNQLRLTAIPEHFPAGEE